MPQTLLQIAKSVARRTKTISPASSISTVVGNDELDVIYQAILDAGQFMLEAHDWSVLRTEEPITTAASDFDYALPSDFHKFIHDTAWDQSNERQMKGSLSPQAWRWANDATVVVGQLRKWFQIKATQGDGDNGVIEIFPTPDAVETLIYEYISENWARTTGGTPKNTMDVDTDVPRIPDHVLALGASWMAKRSESLPYIDDRNDWERLLEQAIANDAPPYRVTANRDPVLRNSWSFRAQWPCNTPDGGFGQ